MDSIGLSKEIEREAKLQEELSIVSKFKAQQLRKASQFMKLAALTYVEILDIINREKEWREACRKAKHNGGIIPDEIRERHEQR